jgi:hypothetical protein
MFTIPFVIYIMAFNRFTNEFENITYVCNNAIHSICLNATEPVIIDMCKMHYVPFGKMFKNDFFFRGVNIIYCESDFIDECNICSTVHADNFISKKIFNFEYVYYEETIEQYRQKN